MMRIGPARRKSSVAGGGPTPHLTVVPVDVTNDDAYGFDLTTTPGITDWMVARPLGDWTTAHKNGVDAISYEAMVGSSLAGNGGLAGFPAKAPPSFSYSDGDAGWSGGTGPVTMDPNDAHYWKMEDDSSFTTPRGVNWTAPADLAEHRVRIIVGTYNGSAITPGEYQMRFVASLSDSSAAAVDVPLPTTQFENIWTVYDIHYAANSDGQTLTFGMEVTGAGTEIGTPSGPYYSVIIYEAAP